MIQIQNIILNNFYYIENTINSKPLRKLLHNLRVYLTIPF